MVNNNIILESRNYSQPVHCKVIVHTQLVHTKKSVYTGPAQVGHVNILMRIMAFSKPKFTTIITRMQIRNTKTTKTNWFLYNTYTYRNSFALGILNSLHKSATHLSPYSAFCKGSSGHMLQFRQLVACKKVNGEMLFKAINKWLEKL